MSLNKLIPIKKLTDKQIVAVYNSIKKTVAAYKDTEPLRTYFITLIGTLLVEPKSILEVLGKLDPTTSNSILEELYAEIINYYPWYSIDFILYGVNNGDKKSSNNPKDVLKDILGMNTSGVAILPPGFDVNEFIRSATESEPKQRTKVTKEKKSNDKIGFRDSKDIENFRLELKSKVIGQDEAIDTLINYVKLLSSGISKKASFLFIGKSGIGKTLLAKLFGERYSGNFMKIDCGGLSHGHEYQKLIGSPPGYVGHVEKSILFELSEKSKSWVFLFDEIEKAHDKFYNFLLGLLDDGYAQDNNGRTLDFTESIFIFTSNKGIGDIKENFVGFAKDNAYKKETIKEILEKSISDHFTPEFRNRIDEFIYFSSLSKKDSEEIVKIKLDEYMVEKTPKLINWIIENSFSYEYGARNVDRFIKRTIGIEIADAILKNKYPVNSNYYTFDIIDNKAVIIDVIKCGEA